MATSHSDLPAVAVRVLGGVGVLGGAVLLAAFVGFPAELNPLRPIFWNLGAIAVAVAAYGPHAAISRRLAVPASRPTSRA